MWSASSLLRDFKGLTVAGVEVGEWLLLALLIVPTVVGNLLHGADPDHLGLALVALTCLCSAALLAFSAEARAALRKPIVLLPIGLLFSLTLLAVNWAAVPGATTEQKDVWRYVNAPASAVLNTSAVLISTLKLLGLAVMFGAAYAFAGEKLRAERAFATLTLSIGAFALYAFVLYTSDPLLQGSRLTAGFGSPNTVGTLFACGALLSLANLRIVARRRGGWLKTGVVAWVALLFCFAALLLSASRGAAGALIVSLVALGALELIASRGRGVTLRSLGVTAGIIAVLAAAAAVGSRVILPRLDNIDRDREIREKMAQDHWRAFQASPMHGHGLGSFDAINHSIITPSNYSYLFDIGATHNAYVQWLEEAGLFGSVPMFLCLILIGIVLLISGLRGKDALASLRIWERSAFACLLVVAIHAWSDFALQVPSFQLFLALLLGLGIGSSMAVERRESRKGAATARPRRRSHRLQPSA